MNIRKFKGFAFDINIWVYGYYTYKKSVDQHCIEWYDEKCLGRRAAVHADSVSQFTGISDKYGNEIFEKDEIVITRHNEHYLGVVEYENNDACYYVRELSGFTYPFQKNGFAMKDFKLRIGKAS